MDGYDELTLHNVIVRCRVVQCVAVRCRAFAVRCRVLQCVALDV